MPTLPVRSLHAKVVLGIVLSVLALAGLCLLPAGVLAVSPNVVISQVYGGGGNSGATYKNDFIELYNAGPAPVSVDGWSVQYASAAGSSWQMTPLNGTIQPGSYYLIQEAKGAGGTVDLPAPNATGTIAMSANNGKVALVSSATALSGTCPSSASIVDFVGFGSANCAETSPTGALVNTTAAIRNLLTFPVDTDNNSVDFYIGAPDPHGGSVPPPPVTVREIHEIQGTGLSSPFEGEQVTTSGVVTGLKTNGFFIQSLNPDADDLTSEGLFVFTSSAPPAAAVVGAEVEVQGTVAEYAPDSDAARTQTEISTPTVTQRRTGVGLPSAINLTSAVLNAAGNLDQLERYEGMRVHVDSVTAVSGTNGRLQEANATSTNYGAFVAVIPPAGRPFREAGIDVLDQLPANAPPGLPRWDGNPERILVDTGQPGGANLAVSTGETVTDITGPLDYRRRLYAVIADGSATAAGGGLSAAVPVPAPAANQFTVASFNLERFFDTANDPGVDDVALTPAAFALRLSKASLAIRNVLRLPDILGVQEVENIGALQALAARINEDETSAGRPTPGYEAFLVEGNDIGGIDVGFLVKRATVVGAVATQFGKDATFLDPVTKAAQTLNDRPPLLLEAVVQPAGRRTGFPVTVIVNHLRSLNDVDSSATVRAKREAQAEYLANLIAGRQAAHPEERIVVVGDFNAFEVNDGYVDVMGVLRGEPGPALATPTVVTATGLTDLVMALPEADRYSYIEDGNAQVLDHVLVNGQIQAASFVYARANADFPESWRGDAARPERLSDHDIPVAYFTFPPEADLAVTETLASSTVVSGRTLSSNVTVSNNGPDVADHPIVHLASTSRMVPVVGTVPGGWACENETGGIACTAAALAAASSAEFQVSYEVACDVPDGTKDTTTVSVSSATPDAVPANDHAADEVTISNPAPEITSLVTDKSLLWPPNHQWVDVAISYTVTDNCGDVTNSLSVASDQPANGTGDGNSAEDWQVVNSKAVRLRAERSGTGGTRTYTITLTSTDSAGGTSARSVTVTVPKSMGK